MGKHTQGATTMHSIKAIIEDLEYRAEGRACHGDAREANELRHRARMLRSTHQSDRAYIAVIERPGEPGRSEPVARLHCVDGLHDGRVMPMGWNMGSSYRVGTTGYAYYVRNSRAGLWQFHPYTLVETVA